MADTQPRARIGLLPTGHAYYWPQFPRLKEMGLAMLDRVRELLGGMGELVDPGLVDTVDRGAEAARLFRDEGVDLIVVFPLGYTPSNVLVAAVKDIDVPLRILNAHEDRTYDYASADTAVYLHHEGICCVPEYAGALVNLGRRFTVRTGWLEDPRLHAELNADIAGAAAARTFRGLRFGLIGQVYTHMTDMPIDEHRLLRATGRMLVRPEVEEIEEAAGRVTEAQIADMTAELRRLYDVDATVTDEHMKVSARLAVAYDEVIGTHDIDAFGYYWWGEKESVTQLRSQSALAVSRLASLGRPGVTEGDVKSAMAIKLFSLLGAGGMFTEFFSMDFEQDFVLMGHDGPANIAMAHGAPRLQHLAVHHGKSGHGLGIDFDLCEGPVTLLNLTQFGAGDTFKLIVSTGQILPGDVLAIGNPNARVQLDRPIHAFIDAWCQQGPSHHVALGYGDQTGALAAFAEAMDFQLVRV